MELNGYDYRLQEKINSASEYVDQLCDGDLNEYMKTIRGLFLSTLHDQGHERLCERIYLYFKDFEDEDDSVLDALY